MPWKHGWQLTLPRSMKCRPLPAYCSTRTASGVRPAPKRTDPVLSQSALFDSVYMTTATQMAMMGELRKDRKRLPYPLATWSAWD